MVPFRRSIPQITQRLQNLPIFYVHEVISGRWLAVVYIVNGQQSVRDSMIYYIHQMVIHNVTKLLLLTSQTKLTLTVTLTLTDTVTVLF